MNKELLKYFLDLKFTLVRKGVERLPEVVQKPVKELENGVMSLLYDFSKEYVEKEPDNRNNKQAGNLKEINVE